MNKRQLDWTNTIFIATAHLLAVAGIVWMCLNFHWQTLVLALVWFGFCGLGITGGYHRLFSHPTYKAIWPLRLFYLLFGAASVQNSALKWSADHRVHHSRVDTPEDPYDITEGFWWAHIGWVLNKSPKTKQDEDYSSVRDLAADPLVMFQHKYYMPLAVLFAAVLPGLIGALWGDWIGGVLVAGFLRLALQWHATFSVNSFAHLIGRQPYDKHGTARDSLVVALMTMGEGYHNFHHRFQSDYRNGIRWFHLDPTKWFVWSMSKMGVTRDLKRAPVRAIERAREVARAAATPPAVQA
jgi:stearoyl-CoA desaturase (delta-9 desaturase)